MLSACVRARVGVGVRQCVREGSPGVGATWGQSKGQDAWVWCLLGWSGLFQARTLSGGSSLRGSGQIPISRRGAQWGARL